MSDAEAEAAHEEGWRETPADAHEETQKALPTIDDTTPATRDELEQKARDLQIKFDGRTSDRKLGDLIAAALKG